MTVTRIDFVGVGVFGPGMRSYQTYDPKQWPSWSVSVDGPSIVLEGTDRGHRRRIEVPRDLCVLYSSATPPAKADDMPAHRQPRAQRQKKQEAEQ